MQGTMRLFAWLYRFADSIFHLKEKGAARNLKRLTSETESDCKYLFEMYGGRVVPELSSGSPYFDFASVMVEVRSLWLRATRDRGTTEWEITSRSSGSPWYPLESVCQKFASKDSHLSSTLRVLYDHFLEIEHFFANGQRDQDVSHGRVIHAKQILSVSQHSQIGRSPGPHGQR
jgi:hypothetical protein